MKRHPSGTDRFQQGRERPPVDPFQKALGLLVRREHSQREIRRKLTESGAEPARSEAALGRLAELGFQDDDRFARSLARTRAASGQGPLRIRAELGTHGLSSEQIAVALEACETDWPSRAKELIARRFPRASWADPGQRRKAIDFLLRRGFDHQSAFAAVAGRGRTADVDTSADASFDFD